MEYSKSDCLYKTKSYQQKAHNIFVHIMLMINKNKKYIFTEACSANLKLYFYYIEKMASWNKKYQDIIDPNTSFKYT